MDQSSQITKGLPAALRVPRPGSLRVRSRLPWTLVDGHQVQRLLTHRCLSCNLGRTGAAVPLASWSAWAGTCPTRCAWWYLEGWDFRRLPQPPPPPEADPCFCCRSHLCSRTMSASSPPRPSPPTTKTVTSKKSRRSVPSLRAGEAAPVLFREPHPRHSPVSTCCPPAPSVAFHFHSKGRTNSPHLRPAPPQAFPSGCLCEVGSFSPFDR